MTSVSIVSSNEKLHLKHLKRSSLISCANCRCYFPSCATGAAAEQPPSEACAEPAAHEEACVQKYRQQEAATAESGLQRQRGGCQQTECLGMLGVPATLKSEAASITPQFKFWPAFECVLACRSDQALLSSANACS